MASESAHQEAGPEPTPQAEVEVTSSQADAARLIIEIDRAAGKETPGFIHKIASARPSRPQRGSPSPGAELPSKVAELIVVLTPEPSEPSSGDQKRQRRFPLRVPRRARPPEAR